MSQTNTQTGHGVSGVLNFRVSADLVDIVVKRARHNGGRGKTHSSYRLRGINA